MSRGEAELRAEIAVLEMKLAAIHLHRAPAEFGGYNADRALAQGNLDAAAKRYGEAMAKIEEP